MLTVENLTACYGEAVVLEAVSLEVKGGGSIAVLGHNGAGKTTLLLAMLGHVKVRSGVIRYGGVDITRMPPHRRVKLGLGWVPQGREVFPSLTVDEHLRVAARKGPWDRARVYELFPQLAERIGNMGTELSGGEQQMLALGRALMTNPSLLLLDEPLEGFAPAIVAEVAKCIRRINKLEGTAIVLVEQHTKIALDLSADAIVLERGRTALRSASAALAKDEELLDQLVGVRRLHDPAMVGRSASLPGRVVGR